MTTMQARIEQWDRFWAYGNLHSFSQVHAGNYRGAVAAFWQERFAALADGSRILDIATGNGAVPLLALDEAERSGRRFAVDATDLAAIEPLQRVEDPALRARLERVRFHPRTPAEQLPFDDGAFDLVASQFGIEYSDPERSLPEAARVLAPGGAAAFVVHHEDSVFLAAVDDELAQLGYVLDEVGLYGAARTLLRTMAEGRGRTSASPKVKKKRAAVDAALARIDAADADAADARMLQGPARYVREILGALERRPAKELLRWLEEARARVEANRRRVRDMRAAACSGADMEAFAGALADAGLADVEVGALEQDDGSLLGWRVTAARP